MSIRQRPARPFREAAQHAHAEHLEHWRSAARRVERAWQVWLASDQAERDWAHDVYLDALAREEDAALRLERHAHEQAR